MLCLSVSGKEKLTFERLEDMMARASKIMVIRHGEKPENAQAPYGVVVDGTQDLDSLLVTGWTRAGALAALFAPSRGPLQSADLEKPKFLFAASDEGDAQSKRPIETISVLAPKLGIETNTTYKVGQESEMAAAAQACDGVVLVCWEHKHIPLIANAILGNTSAPQHWPSGRFDMVWVFDLDANGAAYSFSQVPELLLAGDRSDPL